MNWTKSFLFAFASLLAMQMLAANPFTIANTLQSNMVENTEGFPAVPFRSQF